jgi:hypothetical protein
MAILSDDERDILAGLHRIISRKQGHNSLRRTLSYVAAIYQNGEGPIIEKDLKNYFHKMDEFSQIIVEETANDMSQLHGKANPVPPFTHLLLGSSSRRAQ